MVVRQDRDTYLQWLTGKISDEPLSTNDLKLLGLLYSIPFKYIIEYDSRRRDDGVGLRDLFEYETGEAADWNAPCNVLEVLVSIATYVAEDVIGTHYNTRRTYEWFWMMIDNLGLRGVGDVDDPAVKNYICKTVDRWLSRKFDYNGNGSPFPIKRPKEDQRKMEIWKQICAYIVDNPWLER